MTARILLVDDEEIIHASVKKSLKLGDWTIESAMNARQALELLRTGTYDLVITDLMMPGMDGLELLEEIRKGVGDVPVIMLTGYATIRTAVKAMEIGAFDYIAKPPTREELRGVVGRALKSRDLGEGAAVGVPDDRGAHYSLRDHSWAVVEPGHSSLVGPLSLIDSFFSTYSRYSPLPGRPFWQYVSDPVQLLQYLIGYGVKKMMRWRVPSGGHAVNTLGENLACHFVKPQAFLPKRLDEICQMVKASGSVGTQWVRYNLERAFLIAYVTEMDVVVANSSLKNPRPEYIAALNQQAGMDLSSYLERGYTSVRPEYRGMGIGTRLLEGLTSRVGDRKVFSLIGEDNSATQKIALRNRTRKVSTFFSRRTGKQMGIWIPEAMLDAP